MKQHYITRITAALAIAVIISMMAWAAMIHYARIYSDSMQKNEFLLLEDTTQYDVLLLGSSRMRQGINPSVLDSISKLNSYNMGTNGANIIEVKMLLDAYLLQHKKPAYIVLSADPFLLSAETAISNRLSYITCVGIAPIDARLEEAGVHTRLCRLLPFLSITEFNDSYKGMAAKVLKGEREIPAGDYVYKGYYGRQAGIPYREFVMKPGTETGITARGREMMDAMLALCRQQDIRVIFIYMPEYKKRFQQDTRNYDVVTQYFDSLAAANHIPLFKNDGLPMCDDHTNFENAGHMNQKGGTIFTTVFAGQFNSIR